MLVVAGPVGEREHERTGHPERPARLTAAMAGVHDLGLGEYGLIVDPAPVSLDQLARVHDRRHLEWLGAQPPGQLDADTYLAADSWRAHEGALS